MSSSISDGRLGGAEGQDLADACIHTVTTKPWSVEEAVEEYARRGIGGITLWREACEGRDRQSLARRISDAGLELVSLCRGGFFPSPSSEERSASISDNLSIIEEAAELGAPLVVLVCGAQPTQSLEVSREQIAEGISRVAGRARELGVRLGIEPLHPMYADTRSAVNTLESANELCEQVNASNVGVVVDVYHLWWDPKLEAEIGRAGGADRIYAFHVCDWRVPTRDLLLDRGIMGEGCIDIPRIRGWVENAGFSGFREVEIFSSEYWAQDQGPYLDRICKAYATSV
jgi:sugar phosphate isomerase/epimerase